MLVYNFGTPIWQLGNGVNIWNLLWLSKRLITCICTEYTSIYINTFPNAFTSQMAEKYGDNCISFAKHDHKFMSCTAITLKFKMHWFPNEASCWAEKLWTDIKLASLLPDEDKNFGSSLILDFRISWRLRASQEYEKYQIFPTHLWFVIISKMFWWNFTTIPQICIPYKFTC